MTVRKLPLDAIHIQPGHNYREEIITDDLEESLQAVGLLHPIIVSAKEDGSFLLHGGERRYRAARNLGWEEIDAHILDTDELSLELASIDENIIRRALRGPALDRALARRKELYLLKYPDTAQYVAGARAAANPDQERTKSFTEDTAEKTGKSARTIERSVRRAERLSPATMQAYEQGRISQTQADMLASLQHNDQTQILDHVVGKSVEETRAVISESFPEATIQAPKPTPETTSLQLLEELYMYGQKTVSVLDKISKHDDLNEEIILSVLSLRETLNAEFDHFVALGRQQATAHPQDTTEETPQDPAEDEELAAFPEAPPF